MRSMHGPVAVAATLGLLVVGMTGCDRSQKASEGGVASASVADERASVPKASPEEAKPRSDTPPLPPASKRAARPASKPLPPAPQGPVWFSVGGRLVRLNVDGDFDTVSTRFGRIKDVAIASDGRLAVASDEGIFTIAPGKTSTRRIGTERTPGLADALAYAPDGMLWAVGFKGVFHARSDAGWDVIPKGDLGADVKLLADVVVDATGRPWVVSSGAVHARVGGGWKSLPDGDSGLFFRNADLGDDGPLFAHSKGLFKGGGDPPSLTPWQPPALQRTSVEQMVALRGGGVVVRGYAGIAVLTGDGQLRRYNDGVESFAGHKVGFVATDANARVWAATDHGVVIISADGATTSWTSGAVSALQGEVRGIFPVAGGPKLPEVGQAARGTVLGVVERNGEPVENAAIEMCEKPDKLFRTTPCAGAPSRITGATGPDGSFVMVDVPIRRYRVAVESGGAWTIAPKTCCKSLKAGKVEDVGAIVLGASR